MAAPCVEGASFRNEFTAIDLRELVARESFAVITPARRRCDEHEKRRTREEAVMTQNGSATIHRRNRTPPAGASTMK